jgi:hypothetical protein
MLQKLLLLLEELITARDEGGLNIYRRLGIAALSFSNYPLFLSFNTTLGGRTLGICQRFSRNKLEGQLP